MSDKYNPKLRIKFLRESTLNDTEVEPGNLIVDMDNEVMFMDILSSENEVKRIGFTGSEGNDDYVREEHLQALTKMLEDAANS